MVKILNKPEIKGNFLNLIKSIYDKPTINIRLNGERLKGFLGWGVGRGCLLSPLLFSIVPQGLVSVSKQKKEIKGTHIDMEEVKLSSFTEDMIFYVGNSKKSIKILLELVSSARLQDVISTYKTRWYI